MPSVPPFSDVAIVERNISRPQTVGPESTVELIFAVLGTEDDTTVRYVVEGYVPAFYEGLILQDYRLTPEGAGVWEAVARYGKRAPLKADDADSFSFSFDTTGGREKITQSLETVDRFWPTDFEAAPDFKGAIGVSGDRVEGTEITGPSLNFTLTYRFKKATLTLPYLVTLYKMTGKVNATDWRGFPAGELLFLGASGQQRGNDDPEVAFKFAGSENVEGLTVGDIENIDKKGWEYLWVRYEDDVDTDTLVKVPRAAYVEKVYEEGEFRDLGIGG
jgi:hypothetical protein